MYSDLVLSFLGHFEVPPFSRDTIRSIYHIRAGDVFRLKKVREGGREGREGERERGRES